MEGFIKKIYRVFLVLDPKKIRVQSLKISIYQNCTISKVSGTWFVDSLSFAVLGTTQPQLVFLYVGYPLFPFILYIYSDSSKQSLFLYFYFLYFLIFLIFSYIAHLSCFPCSTYFPYFPKFLFSPFPYMSQIPISFEWPVAKLSPA